MAGTAGGAVFTGCGMRHLCFREMCAFTHTGHAHLRLGRIHGVQSIVCDSLES